MATKVRSGQGRNPLFLVTAAVILATVGVLAAKAPSWAGALSGWVDAETIEFGQTSR
jgi:hypothetical protein